MALGVPILKHFRVINIVNIESLLLVSFLILYRYAWLVTIWLSRHLMFWLKTFKGIYLLNPYMESSDITL